MKDPDIERIRDYIRPSFHNLAFCAVFCLILGFIMLLFLGAEGAGAALVMMLASAAVLAIPAWMEWAPFLRALGELRDLRDDPAMLKAIVRDFDTAPAAFSGDVRLGSLYLFGKGSGALIRRGPECRLVYGKSYYKGGWNWRVCVKSGDSFAVKLLELRRAECTEDSIKSWVDQANALLAE